MGETNSEGSASIYLYVSGAGSGFTVHVAVSIANGGATCSTSFTPK